MLLLTGVNQVKLGLLQLKKKKKRAYVRKK